MCLKMYHSLGEFAVIRVGQWLAVTRMISNRTICLANKLTTAHESRQNEMVI